MGKLLKNEPFVNIYINLPENTVVKFDQNYKITIQNATYSVDANSKIPGLCPWLEADNINNCGYDDVQFAELPFIQNIKIWKDNDGRFAINPMSININGYYLDKIIIHKENPNNIFTDSDIELWKQLFSKIDTEQV